MFLVSSVLVQKFTFQKCSFDRDPPVVDRPSPFSNVAYSGFDLRFTVWVPLNHVLDRQTVSHKLHGATGSFKSDFWFMVTLWLLRDLFSKVYIYIYIYISTSQPLAQPGCRRIQSCRISEVLDTQPYWLSAC